MTAVAKGETYVATPGWNDPPQLSYDPSRPQQTASGRAKLTKRVAFPIQGAEQTSSQRVQTVLPPLSAPPVSSVTLDKSKETEACRPEELSISNEQCSKVVRNLSECLDRSGCDRDMKYDFKMRIKCFESQWKENKFPADLKEKLLRLSEALVDKNDETAEDLLKYVLENFASIASGWIPVISHILTVMDSTT
ncbi:steroid receptor RNA activator 1 isoform X1 [Schistocerca serialis cubense]|uniref:steroid receptor RNA activator 1 isoform X1 n=1 Tax=Schistocerca serialis cubense TaxID=2023355 RepID=UPI00214F3A61|nr:steroid receptor RNA activator 1 isoform X1 [Schistocerca serialis cubense]